MPLLITALGACGYGSRAAQTDVTPVEAKGAKLSADDVRIGYFANTTHATALAGMETGIVQRELGGTAVKPQVFNAGPSAVEALNSDAVDMAWLGPSPAVNGWARSGGKALRIVSGSASGGASLVVNPKRIKNVGDLKGRTIATPQLGNTQDVALLDYLAGKGYRVDARTGEGDVTVARTENKVTPAAFEQGSIDGAWVPEPTASQLVARGGRVLVDERTQWKDGRFVNTNLVVSPTFLKAHPDVVEAVLRGSVKTNAWIGKHPDEAKRAVNAQLEKLVGKPLPTKVLDRAFRSTEVTDDPLAATLRTQAAHAARVGLLDKPDLRGIYDLRLLNKVLQDAGRPPADDAGLGASWATGPARPHESRAPRR
ncbi:ABC transporter substrate-binding protein [Streptomyces sp. MTZ3.1]|uniref:ABC transporter substrate-binding protein n=1 Tax=Streptomyces meridianus TaxID=2938945 RepID=A0ABT0X5G8_9ACTN|nr:ABC transporter substrate-binding protein [Streptomyces meridianus]MCM2576902.1 ABC transporter substrate-binding protein [Streptomyces meridianus]